MPELGGDILIEVDSIIVLDGDGVLTDLLAADLVRIGIAVVHPDEFLRQCHDKGLARLFVGLVVTAVRAELLDLEAIGIVPPVLLGDVVTVLAHLAGQSDLRPYVGTRRHVSCLSLFCL
jgi:hypothetical protein